MTPRLATKYGAALTGSDWAGLPLRIGHIPEAGHLEDLSTDTDALLIWSGGPSQVSIRFRDPKTGQATDHEFERWSGMMDLLPRGTLLHRVEWRGKVSTCTSVNFPPTCLAALCSHEGVSLDPLRGPRFGLIDAHVVDLVHRLQAQAEGVDFFGNVYVQSLSLALASYVLARYGAESKPLPLPRQSGLSGEQRRKIEQFVEQELDSDFGLVDLAELVGYSPDHFSRLFRRSYSLSPHKYVLARRVERAMAMLRDGSHSIAHIASACGFANQGHLTTAFRRQTGTTPGAYRKA